MSLIPKNPNKHFNRILFWILLVVFFIIYTDVVWKHGQNSVKCMAKIPTGKAEVASFIKYYRRSL